MITDYSSAEFRNVVLEVNEILALLVSCHIVEMNVLVAPLEVMNNTLVRQLLLHDEDVLERTLVVSLRSEEHLKNDFEAPSSTDVQSHLDAALNITPIPPTFSASSHRPLFEKI